MGVLLLGVALTLLSAACTNVGKALQKAATRTLPRLAPDRRVLAKFVRHPTWALGIGLDLGGGLLSIAALAHAPVSVVQPVAASGLAVLALFSHAYLDERLSRSEWAAVGLAGCGTVGVAASAPTPPATPPPPSASGLAALLLLLAAAALAGVVAVRRAAAAAGGGHSHPHPRAPGRLSTHRPTSPPPPLPPPSAASAGASPQQPASGVASLVAAAAAAAPPTATEDGVLAAAAGACFALSAASCRAGLLAGGLAGPAAGLAASVGLTGAGVGLQTRALARGAAMTVCTVGAVASMAVGLAAGGLCLGERPPETAAGRALAAASWAAIAFGVAGLSGGGGGGGGGGRGGVGGAGGGRTPVKAGARGRATAVAAADGGGAAASPTAAGAAARGGGAFAGAEDKCEV